MEPKLITSTKLAFFQRSPSIFVYHDLVGYILEMDATVLELFHHFRTPSTVVEAVERFRDRWRPEEIENFVHIFQSHSCLVSPDEDEEEAVMGFYPIIGPWVVYYNPRPGEVVVACKHRHWKKNLLLRLGRLEASIWELCKTGERTILDIVTQVSKTADNGNAREATKDVLFRWTHSDYQLLKLARAPVYERIGAPAAYLRSVMPYEPYEGGALDEEPAVVDLRPYHTDQIADAGVQFDIEETTLSHMFRVPHPALHGRSYGGAFAARLIRDGVLKEGQMVHEIGGGVGFFCRSFLEEVERSRGALYATLRYQILDLSQVLQDAQRMLNLPFGERVRFVLGDAQRLPFADSSIGLAISNEVIADLETVRLTRDDLETDPAALPEAPRRTLERLRALGIDCRDAPGIFHINVGALDLVEDLSRALAPGGHAYLVEYGHTHEYPVASTHLDHTEFSIHFGHLEAAARTLGLQANVIPMLDFLEWKLDCRVLSTTRSYFELLRALLARKGIRLEKVAYTEEMFQDLLQGRFEMAAFHKLDFRPVRDRALGLHPSQFHVLHILRPDS